MKSIKIIYRYFAIVLVLIVSLYTIYYRPNLNVGGRKLTFYVLLMGVETVFFIVNNNYKHVNYYLKVFKTELLYVGLILLIVIFHSIGGGDNAILISRFKSFLFLFMNAFFVVILFRKFFREDNNYIQFALVVGSIAAIISTGCIVNEDFRYFIDHNVQYYEEDLKQSAYLFRCFGLSSGLLYEYGIIQGVILAIGFMCLSKNKWFIFFIPLFALSIILNARTGIIITFVGAFIMSMVSMKIGNILKTLALMVVALMAFIWLLPQFDISKDSIAFITEFTDEIQVVFTNKDMSGSDTYAALTKDDTMPQSLDEWVLGTGKDIMYGGIGRSSDVGYIRQINYGGIIYIILLYVFILHLFFRWKKFNKGQAYLFLVTFLIANFKGDVIGTSIMDFFFILYVFSITGKAGINNRKLCINTSR